jgi:uncharacterized protein YutE (UPF0331/DUF86 family)
MNYLEMKRQSIEAFIADEVSTQAERVERFVELNELFGLQGDKLLLGGLQSQLALHEFANSYVNGNFMAVVLLSQAFIEHSLSGEFIISGQNTIAESSFKKIIETALEDKITDQELYESINELRKLRNPYVHAKSGLKNGSLVKKMIDGKFESVEDLVKSDALNALTTLQFFMDKNVIIWFPEEEA